MMINIEDREQIKTNKKGKRANMLYLHMFPLHQINIILTHERRSIHRLFSSWSKVGTIKRKFGGVYTQKWRRNRTYPKKYIRVPMWKESWHNGGPIFSILRQLELLYHKNGRCNQTLLTICWWKASEMILLRLEDVTILFTIPFYRCTNTRTKLLFLWTYWMQVVRFSVTVRYRNERN